MNDLKQYKDTNYYVNINAEVYHLLPSGRYKKLKGCNELKTKSQRIRMHIGDKKIPLSKIVWETFVGPVKDGYVLSHKNGCSSMNDLANLKLIKRNEINRIRYKNKTTRKIINLSTREIYKGSRQAAKSLKHSRKCITKICDGVKLQKLKLNIAWYDDVNGKPFRADYLKYYNRYMKESWD